MTIHKKTVVDLDKEELLADLRDGIIDKEEYNRRLTELEKNYVKRKRDNPSDDQDDWY